MDNELPAGLKSRGPRKNKKNRKNGSALSSTEEATPIDTEVNVKAKEATEVINNTMEETTKVNLNTELVPTSTKKKRKREKTLRRGDNTKMDSTDHGSVSLKSSDSGGDLHLESVVGINGENEPEENRELRRSRMSKKRKQTKIISPETNNTEHENGATLESTSKEREQQLEDGPHQTDVEGTSNLESPTQNADSDSKGKKRKKKKKNEPNDHERSDGIDTKNVVGLNSSDTKGSSPPIDEQSGFSKGVKTASVMKQADCIEVSHNPEIKEIETNNRKKPNSHQKKRKSSELGNTREPVEDNNLDENSSQCLVGKNTSGFLENFETTSSVVGVVSEQAVDILCEKDSVNYSDTKEISPPTDVENGLPSGAKTASIMKQDHCTGVRHVPENKEIGTYKRKKPRHHPRKGKSSELGRTMKLVVDNSVDDTSSQCLVGKDTSGFLENIETTSSVVGAVLEQAFDILREKDSINHSDTKESSPTTDEQSGFPSGVKTASIMKQDECTEVSHVPENKVIETYKRKRPKKGKSSESGRTMELGVDNNIDDTSSQCLVGKNTSGFLKNVETTSSVIEAVSEQAVDILGEKDSVNCSDIKPASHKRKKVKKMIDLRESACGNKTLNDASALDVSEESYDQKSGENLVRGHDALKLDGNNCCKNNGSGDLLKLDTVNIETTMEEAPSSQRGEAKDGVHLDATIEEGNLFQIPGSLPERTLVSRSQKKLLILDVNGLLVDFVSGGDRQFRPDIIISKKAVYKRPYCDEFIEFCFEKFNVGVWSSRMKWNMDKVIWFLFDKSRHKLLFCWDQSHCSATGTNTLENNNKPLVFKELRKLWEKLEPNLPWEIGEYDETNTLLLDDSPYKALRNPDLEGIFGLILKA
ncbi:uncharacterized protein LOC133830710 isoform X2 [Humulus lupulus]|uniref:uncharacterized protein LOC133830710 isoform X2 n=1 Tax=Humulus lupulus TaxID=3486 RepID=UPI002B40AAB6|nr:uncharacterized protein LOC133830710 isoform X2 [Humulus lupulus]